MLSGLLPLLAVAAACCDSTSPEPASFTRVDGSVLVDGRLDEPSWLRAPAVTRFFEVYPGNLRTPPARTTVRFVYDERSVYVGINAYDPNSAAIRSSLVRRDQSLADQDYVELLLDPLNTRRTAMLFRTNPHGVQVDGVYDEALRRADLAPDFAFDVGASVTAEGWSAEFRIPLTTLRRREGSAGAWAFAVYRNWPRYVTSTMASVPRPRSAVCLLCFAGEAGGIALESTRGASSATPHVTFRRREESSQAPASHFRGGIDARWQPRADISLDMTVRPDFSHVEADRLQLTANTRFALSVPEKRPFFLEGSDLLATPLPAIYTRMFTEPDYGLRITGRQGEHEYSALLLRDMGGGIVIEPAATASRVAAQDFESLALAGRYMRQRGPASLGMLMTGRFNDDGSRNLVVGFDADWALSLSDRIRAQFLRSATHNPNRPDLLDAWTGQRLVGSATTLDWVHLDDAWHASVSARSLSRGFRAWNGFVAQVDVASVSASSGLYFYPRDSVLTRISPTISLAQSETVDGTRLSRRASPSLSIQAAHDTQMVITWSPNEEGITPMGLRSFDSLSLSLSTTPVAWMPGAGATFSIGEGLDLATGDVAASSALQVVLPLRLQKFDLSASIAHQSLERRFSEKNFQLDATWHLSKRLYAQAIHQTSTLSTGDLRRTIELTSLLVSYQTNWQTRYFVGFRQSDGLTREREIFAKLSYVFSR